MKEINVKIHSPDGEHWRAEIMLDQIVAAQLTLADWAAAIVTLEGLTRNIELTCSDSEESRAALTFALSHLRASAADNSRFLYSQGEGRL
jgi:hypothetical protein